ncbi:hypothetical protein TWF192_006879 [Orbilia oligospora]|uniref:Uncharacterized protein n=1 Tax=Orbilia oligospora TaxID=2813651 RepID=A0A6G1M6I4_ORBOL|nr:hypothetical protein TWF191_003698 [Orbilia oligospora]KAF3246365.1 hypothetical protein TWF192_006879 [Orbilia oligospora]
MELVSKLVGCCGCGRSGESSSSKGQYQSRTDAVINTQPGLVEPPMVVRVAKTVRQLTTRRRYPKPTWEEIEAFYQEGKELARLQEEAEAADKLELEQKSEEQLQQSQQDHGKDLMGKDPSRILIKDSLTVPPNPHLTFDGPSDTPFLDDDDENEPRLPPVAHISPRHLSNPGHSWTLDLDLRRVSNHNDWPLPALRQTGENIAISEVDTDEIVAVLAAPDIACTTPTFGGTQKSKKMRLFFQDDRSRSSVYPSDEESMVYGQGTWSPRSPRIPSPAQSRLAVNKTRQNRHVSPGNLRIPSIMQVLSDVLSPSLAEPPKLPSPRKLAEPSELLDPDEFELTADDASVSDPDGENDIQPVPQPDEFGFVDVLISPPASPLLNPQPDRSISPIFSGVPFLKLEMERIRRRLESETLYKSPWDKSSPDASDIESTGNSPTTINNGKSKPSHVRNGVRQKEPASTFGFLTVGSISPLGALSSLSSLSLASNISMQAFKSTSSLFFSPSFGASSVFYSNQVLAGLPSCAEAEAPIHDAVADATVTTFAGSLRKGGEAIAKNISTGFTTLFRRFGTRAVELQATEPQPTATSVPYEPARSALSYTEGTPALSPTPSNLTLMRRIVGLKVSGTLHGAAVASEAMSNGLFTSDYTDCGPDDKPENPFEGFVWDAPDGKIPWYCDEDGVHFDDKAPVNRDIPAEYLCDPVMVPWEELSKETELPVSPTSTAAGPKGVRVRQLTPPAAASSTVAIEVSSEVASLATTSTQGSLVCSAGLVTGMPEELDVPSAMSSVDSFPRYIPISHRDARHSTGGLDLGKERAFYQRYEDRMKSAVKPYMRGRRSFQRY